MTKTIITIGREYGSGGYEIAQKLAEKLGFKFYDKNAMAEIAEKDNASADDRKRNLFKESGPIFLNDSGEKDFNLFKEQGKFLVNLVEEGNCVIIGRRADYYLKDNPNALHLFFYADTDFRAERVSGYLGISKEDALAELASVDRKRKISYEYTTGRKWGDRHNYDRMICTSSLGIDKAVDEIIALIQ